jgi:hypothetical protein
MYAEGRLDYRECRSGSVHHRPSLGSADDAAPGRSAGQLRGCVRARRRHAGGQHAGTTFKARSAGRDGRATLCIITNQEPFNFVSVEGRVDVETGDLVRNTRLVFENIEGTGFVEPEDLEGWLAAEQRVILRIHPERVFGVIR